MKNQTRGLYPCPVCLEATLLSEDPLDNEWVALGEAVCSKPCHEAAYDLMRGDQAELLFESSSTVVVLAGSLGWLAKG